MNLILSNGYPYPYPDGLTEAQQEELSMAAPAYRLVIAGVVHFEQKYTTTIEFIDHDAYRAAQAITGWAAWGDHQLVLEAPTSAADGYDYPAIVVGKHAYCGYQLAEVADGAAAALQALLRAVKRHDDSLNRREMPPDGDDYNELLNIIESAQPIARVTVPAAPQVTGANHVSR